MRSISPPAFSPQLAIVALIVTALAFPPRLEAQEIASSRNAVAQRANTTNAPAARMSSAERNPAALERTRLETTPPSSTIEHGVRGTVHSAEDGIPLPGVNIVIKGTTIGTTTDDNGLFTLTARSPDDTLVFSFIGFRTAEIPIEGRTDLVVALQPDITMLEEAVVVGFGIQPRVNLSGAVDQIEARQLQSRPISSVAQGLQGMIPNLNIDYLEGSPGAAPRINIRGFTSINGGDPLILIDGIPSEARELTRLDPQDVASVSVLKDASSAAIYGARAAFGVLLVETRRGTREGINVGFSSLTSWDKPTILPNKIKDPYIYMRWQDMSTTATPWDYINYSDDMYEWARQRSDNPEGTPAVREDPDNPGTWQYMGNRDWTEFFLSDYGLSVNNTLSLQGRAQKTSFYLSGSYDRQSGALQLADDRFDRWSVRSNVDYQPRDWLTVGNRSYINNSERIMPSRWEWGQWGMWAFYNHAPMAWDKNPDGTWANTSVGILASELTQGGDLSDGLQSYQTTFDASVSLIKDKLSIHSDFTLRRELRDYNYDYKRYSVGYGPDDIRELGSTVVYRDRTTYDYNALNVYGRLNLNYGSHEITSLIGFNQEENEQYALITQIGNVISSDLPSVSLALGDPSVSDYFTGWAIRGVFGRVNYVFDDRYILEFNGRYDGSSRFPDGDRFGFFPSASAAWRIDQEAFMNRFTWLDMFKVRASYGALGNQSVAPFGYIPAMSATRANYIVGDTRPLSISAPGLVSPNYTWEHVSTKNLGVDVDFFGSRLIAAFDVYSRETTGMLTLGRELPRVLGTTEPSENAADLETSGWELSLGYRDYLELFGSDLSFSTRVTLADSRTRITAFDNPERFLNQYYVGQDVGEIWGLTYDGLFQSEEEIANHADQSQIIPWGVLPVVPGWPKFSDLDGDGLVRAGDTVDDPGDLSIIGNTQPRYRYGLNLDLFWKDFDVRVFLQGVGNRDFYPQHYLYWGFYQQPYAGGYVHLLDFYRAQDDPESIREQHSQAYLDSGLADANPDAEFPVLQAWLSDVNTPGIGRIPNSGFLLDASYLRLKNLTFGYTLPRSLSDRLGVTNARVYVSGENLAEWSELSDFFDPEAVTDDSEGYRYPFQRRYSVGVNINF